MSRESLATALAFKAYEIEELQDILFFRPAGILFAHAARAFHLTPNVLSVAGALVGMGGGAACYFDDLGWVGFWLLVLHGVLDSSDGQLARMTQQTSQFGRVLDGLSGYLTHAIMYVALAAGAVARGAGPWFALSMAGAAVASIAHASMYDYHRTAYQTCVVEGASPSADASAPGAPWILRVYEAVQGWLVRPHQAVEHALAIRSVIGRVREEDRARYRLAFYWPVRGWNLFGDNTRRNLLGLLVWIHHMEWFPWAVLLPLNAAFVLVWLWQARVDRRFLTSL